MTVLNVASENLLSGSINKEYYAESIPLFIKELEFSTRALFSNPKEESSWCHHMNYNHTYLVVAPRRVYSFGPIEAPKGHLNENDEGEEPLYSTWQDFVIKEFGEKREALYYQNIVYCKTKLNPTPQRDPWTLNEMDQFI